MFVALNRDTMRFRGFVVGLVPHQEIMVSLRCRLDLVLNVDGLWCWGVHEYRHYLAWGLKSAVFYESPWVYICRTVELFSCWVLVVFSLFCLIRFEKYLLDLLLYWNLLLLSRSMRNFVFPLIRSLSFILYFLISQSTFSDWKVSNEFSNSLIWFLICLPVQYLFYFNGSNMKWLYPLKLLYWFPKEALEKCSENHLFPKRISKKSIHS